MIDSFRVRVYLRYCALGRSGLAVECLTVV